MPGTPIRSPVGLTSPHFSLKESTVRWVELDKHATAVFVWTGPKHHSSNHTRAHEGKNYEFHFAQYKICGRKIESLSNVPRGGSGCMLSFGFGLRSVCSSSAYWNPWLVFDEKIVFQSVFIVLILNVCSFHLARTEDAAVPE